jgi:DNA-directed RNA polymerase specialized sigma24 family protein
MPPTLSVVEKEVRFKNWVREYSDMLFSHVVLRGFDRDSARDFVQETFFSAWKSMDQLKEKLLLRIGYSSY